MLQRRIEPRVGVGADGQLDLKVRRAKRIASRANGAGRSSATAMPRPKLAHPGENRRKSGEGRRFCARADARRKACAELQRGR